MLLSAAFVGWYTHVLLQIFSTSATFFLVPNPQLKVLRNSGYYPDVSYTSSLNNASKFSVICQLSGCFMVSSKMEFVFHFCIQKKKGMIGLGQ